MSHHAATPPNPLRIPSLDPTASPTNSFLSLDSPRSDPANQQPPTISLISAATQPSLRVHPSRASPLDQGARAHLPEVVVFDRPRRRPAPRCLLLPIRSGGEELLHALPRDDGHRPPKQQQQSRTPPFIARVTRPLHHVARRTMSADLAGSICCLLQPRVAKDQCRPPPLLLTSSASMGSHQVRHRRPLSGMSSTPASCAASSSEQPRRHALYHGARLHRQQQHPRSCRPPKRAASPTSLVGGHPGQPPATCRPTLSPLLAKSLCRNSCLASVFFRRSSQEPGDEQLVPSSASLAPATVVPSPRRSSIAHIHGVPCLVLVRWIRTPKTSLPLRPAHRSSAPSHWLLARPSASPLHE
ncbi:uncharacterized protein LOC125551662 [Triticum urartu]|uniref:uncharacterized protein LOC125551662 n=1 Tax=Triticum urartu TaxID=4572 RepID=UPI0020447CE6|nr:uncharacterized protein LOC125551662 [Triticum urartu]